MPHRQNAEISLAGLARNILTTLGARIGILAISLISSVLLARSLGPEGRGLLALVLLLPEWARILGLLGFEHANSVYAGREPERRLALVWQSAALAGVIGGIFAIAGAGFFAFGSPGMPTLMRGPLWLYLLPLFAVPACLVVDYWCAILRGMNHILSLNALEVGTKVVSLILILVFVGWLHLDVAGAVVANILTSVGLAFVVVVLLIRSEVWGMPSFDRYLWKRTSRFAIPAYSSTVAAHLNYRVDEVFVAVLLPPEQLGFYVLAVALAERIWIFPGAVSNALLPHLTNSREHDPALPAAIARCVMICTGVGCFFVFAFADVIVNTLYSHDFAPAVAPLRWLLPGIFFLSIGKVLGAELFAREKPRYLLWATSIAAVVNIGSNLLLVPRLGISGAALASTFSYSALSVIVIWFYLRETGVGWTDLIPRRTDLLAARVWWS